QHIEMSSIKCMLVVLFCLIALMAPLISAQCPSTNNPRCSVWKQGGFCTSNFYTIEFRQNQCGTECGLC
ncbi:hypothetical protein PENTCL1PPCAC_7715, partial [Pristionchus entomophagus]